MSTERTHHSPASDGGGRRFERLITGLEWIYARLLLLMFCLSLVSFGFFVVGLTLGGNSGIDLARQGNVVMKLCIACSALAVMLGLLRCYVAREHTLTLDPPASRAK